MTFHLPNEFRIREGPYASDDSMADMGAFAVPMPVRFWNGMPIAPVLNIIAAAGEGWEHVSVSVAGQPRCPTWTEMDFVKGLFWDAQDCVAQLHVPEDVKINHHPYVLHLWRQQEVEWARPPDWMVGPKAKEPT